MALSTWRHLIHKIIVIIGYIALIAVVSGAQIQGDRDASYHILKIQKQTNLKEVRP